ncbi:MAG: hypothetical protein IJU50_03385 [Lachnospiraceae bacterium]|nr:hypothetical protein [Lachnospiraceae bacterium]
MKKLSSLRRAFRETHPGRSRKRVFLIAALLMSLTGCGSVSRLAGKLPESVVLTTGNEAGELFFLEEASCRKEEALVYLTSLEGAFARSYGKESLALSLGEESFLERLEKEALARLGRVKAMGLMAAREGCVLEEAELALCEEAARAYLSSETIGNLPFEADQELLASMYADYALAEKLYNEISLSVDPEISDDEARMIALEQILIKTWKEKDGKLQQVSEEEKDALWIMASEIRREAVSKEQGFEALVAMYNEGNTGNLVVSALDAPKEVLALSKGEISPVVETEEGYAIYRCISPVVSDDTEENKKKIAEERRKEAFAKEYDDFVEGLNLSLDQKLWDEIVGKDYSSVDTPDFFMIYRRVFNK